MAYQVTVTPEALGHRSSTANDVSTLISLGLTLKRAPTRGLIVDSQWVV
jgi:hypothetical protein